MSNFWNFVCSFFRSTEQFSGTLIKKMSPSKEDLRAAGIDKPQFGCLSNEKSCTHTNKHTLLLDSRWSTSSNR